MAADVVRTGPQSSVGILMSDDSMLSAGATSALRIDRYEYDATTNRGRFDSSLSSFPWRCSSSPHREKRCSW